MFRNQILRSFAALILVFWAIAFAGHPADASVIPELENIYGAADFSFGAGVKNRKLYEPFNSGCFVRSRIEDAFASGPLTFWTLVGHQFVIFSGVLNPSGAPETVTVRGVDAGGVWILVRTGKDSS